MDSELRDAKGSSCHIRRELWICFLLAIATLAVYRQAGNFEFVSFDDGGYVYENPHVKTGLTRENIRWALTSTHERNWHPITWLSHMLDCEI